MTTALTPAWLYSDTIVVHHFEQGAHGRLATPIPATETVTGRFQRSAKRVLNASGQEEVSQAVAFLPGVVEVGPQDEIEYDGVRYQVATVTRPSVGGAGPAYTEVRLL